MNDSTTTPTTPDAPPPLPAVRPVAITVICILGIIGAFFTIPMVFTDITLDSMRPLQDFRLAPSASQRLTVRPMGSLSASLASRSCRSRALWRSARQPCSWFSLADLSRKSEYADRRQPGRQQKPPASLFHRRGRSRARRALHGSGRRLGSGSHLHDRR